MQDLLRALLLGSCLLGCVAPPPAAVAPVVHAPAPLAKSLHVAALEGDSDAVRGHLAAGTVLDDKDDFGNTPLQVAITFGRDEVAKLLIEGGAALDTKSEDGSTPLHTAAFFCRGVVVERLLERGVPTRTRNHYGNTPFDNVAAPFEEVSGLYEQVGRGIAPLGGQLDLARIANDRPKIAAMLQAHLGQDPAPEYAPHAEGDWQVSTPDAQGVAPRLVAELYLDAAELQTLYGLLVVKNDHLIAEAYFNGGSREAKRQVASVTKSVTSALAGIALERGCLPGLDAKMVSFFPELSGGMDDPRKTQITVRQLLQMRAGYPWEEREPPHLERLFSDSAFLPHLVDFELSSAPGEAFRYSNLSSHALGVILARACKTDLRTFAEQHLFGPMNVTAGLWPKDADGNYYGFANVALSARDMAKLGKLYLHRGQYGDKRLVSEQWVDASLSTYSHGMYDNAWRSPDGHYLGPYLRDVGYGYQWWTGRAGAHRFSFARGHGGNLVVILHDLDMLLVTLAEQDTGWGAEAWMREGAIIQLVGKFIRSLPPPAGVTAR